MLLTISEWLSEAWVWLSGLVAQVSYPGVFGFMALESSFFPFPSEVVMPPAGAAARAGEMSLLLVIAAGIAGSLAGAFFNYGIAVWFGRSICLKIGRPFGITEAKFEKAESFFRRHGEITTFVSRLIPGVRQVISFPAGLARMNLARFTLFTALGAGLWVTVLTLIGYWVGADLEVVEPLARKVLLFLAPALLILLCAYLWWHLRRRRRVSGEEETA